MRIGFTSESTIKKLAGPDSSLISESMSMPFEVSSLWEVTDIGIVGDGRCVLVPSGIESQDVPFEQLIE